MNSALQMYDSSHRQTLNTIQNDENLQNQNERMKALCEMYSQNSVMLYYFSKEEIENYKANLVNQNQEAIYDQSTSCLSCEDLVCQQLITNQIQISEQLQYNQEIYSQPLLNCQIQNKNCLNQSQKQYTSSINSINNKEDNNYSINNVNNRISTQIEQKCSSIKKKNSQGDLLSLSYTSPASSSTQATQLKKFNKFQQFNNLIPKVTKKIQKQSEYQQKFQQQEQQQYFQSKNCIKGVQLKVIKFQKQLLKQNKKLGQIPEYKSYITNFGQKCNNTFDLQTLYRKYHPFTKIQLLEINNKQKIRKRRKQKQYKEKHSEKEIEYTQTCNIIKSYSNNNIEIQNLVDSSVNLDKFNEEIEKINRFNFYNRVILYNFLQSKFSNIVYRSNKILDKESYNIYGLILQNNKLQDTDLLTTIKQ